MLMSHAYTVISPLSCCCSFLSAVPHWCNLLSLCSMHQRLPHWRCLLSVYSPSMLLLSLCCPLYLCCLLSLFYLQPACFYYFCPSVFFSFYLMLLTSWEISHIQAYMYDESMTSLGKALSAPPFSRSYLNQCSWQWTSCAACPDDRLARPLWQPCPR